MLIVLESIRSRVMENKKKGRSTWIVIDEFHHMTERPYTAHKVNQFWKEFRAMGGICTGITQNIVVRPDRALYKVA
jgi:type IV secretory pathway VirB4 component